jgi:hypothetical protein
MPTRKKKTVKKIAKKPLKTAKKRKAPARSAPSKGGTNIEAYWDAYRHLEKRVNTAWKKLEAASRRPMKLEKIVEARNELLVLLGEANYMARECQRMAKKNLSQ